MKKSKALLSLLSMMLCAVFMFTAFSSNLFGEPTPADINVNGAKGRLKEIGNGLFNMFSENSEENSNAKSSQIPETYVYLGGYPIGLKLYADGVIVVGTEVVDTANGNVNPAEKAGLEIGDIIKKVNGNEVAKNSDVSDIIEKSAGEEIHFVIKRGEKESGVVFRAEFSVSENKYKAGIWIRDSSAGIGTVTFCTQDGYFASLGHAVCDIDTKATLPISEGECCEAKITGYIKVENGTAGELCGFLENKRTGYVYSNEEKGVYGSFDKVPNDKTLLPIARKNEVKTGEAEIYTTVQDGVIEKYTVNIERVDKHSADNKNLTVKVTDAELIRRTGGIIQGMSGSPIVQNGKIVGAVTHVFLNESTGGYGIFAETMLDNLASISENAKLQNAS